MPTAPMWIGARLAAMGIAEGLGASITLVYRAAWRGDTIGALCPVHLRKRTCIAQRPAEAIGFDSVFLAWDFVGKNQAESKSNFVGRSQGRGTGIQKIHSVRSFWCCRSGLN